jgi:hypothetical protein
MAHEVLLRIDGWPTWRTADGRLWPLIAGGSAGPGAGDSGDGGNGGQGGGQGGTSSAPAGTAGPSGTGGEPGGSADLDWSDDWKPEDARKTFKTLREIAKKAEQEARDAKTALESRSREGMTEAEKLAARNRELEAQVARSTEALRLGAMREAFREAGMAAKAKNPATVWKLIDRDSIEWGPDGEVVNATELIRDLRRAEPWAFEGRQGAQGSADAAQGSGQQPAQVGSRSDENDAFNRWFRGAAGRT